MSTNWAAAAKQYAGGGGGKYLKLKEDGATVSIVLMDEPAIREQYWSNADRQYYPDPGAGRELQTSFPVSIYNVDEERSQLLTMSKGLFTEIAKEIEAEVKGDPAGHVFKLRRDGQGLKTRWSVNHKGPVSDELSKALADCDVYDVIEEDESGCTRALVVDEDVEPKKAEPRKSEPADDDDVPF